MSVEFEDLNETVSTQFVFDPTAGVVIDVGLDGAPGQAGIDDAGNGVTDDRAELGATGSDDLCHVVFGLDAEFTNTDPHGNPRLSMGTGAFRPVQTDETIPPGTPTRILYHAVDSTGRAIEWMDFSPQVEDAAVLE